MLLQTAVYLYNQSDNKNIKASYSTLVAFVASAIRCTGIGLIHFDSHLARGDSLLFEVKTRRAMTSAIA